MARIIILNMIIIDNTPCLASVVVASACMNLYFAFSILIYIEHFSRYDAYLQIPWRRVAVEFMIVGDRCRHTPAMSTYEMQYLRTIRDK